MWCTVQQTCEHKGMSVNDDDELANFDSESRTQRSFAGTSCEKR